MKMRSMIAAVAAMAVSAVCVAALPASAAETTVAYTPSADSLGVGDDGVTLRRNIFNIWGQNNVQDIAGGATAVNKYLTVTFNVSGIGTDSAGEDGVAYCVYLGGSIAGESYHNGEYVTNSIPASQLVNINGDGQYTVTWETSSENIDCLYLQSNINIYAYGKDDENPATCTIDVVSIVTDDGVEETEAPETTTTAAGTTTTAAGTTTTAAGTTTAAAGTTTTAASTTNTATGDNSGIAVAVAALAVAGGVALVTKKNRK